MNLIRMIRWLLTALLCFGIYTETGVWTTIFSVLVAMALEIHGWVYRNGIKT